MDIGRAVVRIGGGLLVLALVVTPLLVPRPSRIAFQKAMLLASADESFEEYDYSGSSGDVVDGYPVPQSYEEAGITSADDQPCDNGACGVGSLKEDAVNFSDEEGSDYGYLNPSDSIHSYDYGYEEDSWSTYYERSTASNITSGLSQVPSIFFSAFSAPTTHTTYTTSYVPVQQQVSQPVYQQQIYQQPLQQVAYPQYQQQAVSNPGAPSVTYVSSPTSYSLPITAAQVQAQPQQILQAPSVQQTWQRAYLMQDTPQVRVNVTSTRVDAPAGPTQPHCSITASPKNIALGATTTITWSATGADTAAIDAFGIVNTQGSTVVALSTTTTFSLSVANGVSAKKCSVKVTIDPALCTSACPPGFVCTPVAGTVAPKATTTTAPKKSFWSIFGL